MFYYYILLLHNKNKSSIFLNGEKESALEKYNTAFIEKPTAGKLADTFAKHKLISKNKHPSLQLWDINKCGKLCDHQKISVNFDIQLKGQFLILVVIHRPKI